MKKHFTLTLATLASLLLLIGFKGSKPPLTPSTQQTSPSLIPSSVSGKAVFNQNDHPLYARMNAFMSVASKNTPIKPTGLNRKTYLNVIEGQVRAMKKYQNDQGRLIDPIEKTEKYYTTPCYAHSISALVASSHISKDSPLAISGYQALEASLNDMANATVNGNHGDFYTYPVMLAYMLFKPHVDQARLKKWNEKLTAIDISKLYAFYNSKRNLNWILVHSAGEFLRAVNGFTDLDYVEQMLGGQMDNFTDLGMYNEHGNPLAYDLFARFYANGMLKSNYQGKYATPLRALLWQGGWSSLFMQSPFGEVPTGYRSSHHIWNEAEQCVIFETYASEYAKLGSTKEASIFKRAAMLSLSSITQWVRQDGAGYIVKNRFPLAAKHGYERYSVHTCYNMLACSMLAQAWQFSDDTISEQPAPADLGGFVVPMAAPFHKVFANAGGTYLEYDTRGDQEYNPTGILRMHIKHAHPQLGPSDGLAAHFSGEGISIATGLSWQNTGQSWTSLAAQQLKPENLKVCYETADSVMFLIHYKIENKGTLSNAVSITETIGIKNNTITVKEKIEGVKGRKRFTWPMLTFDGENKTDINLQSSSASLVLEGKGVKLSVTKGKGIKIYQGNTTYTHRNGIAVPLYVDFEGDQVTLQFRAM